jgi:hypothetical protein
MSTTPILTEQAAPLAESAAAPSITIERLIFSDGSTVELQPKDVVVLVGPNNAGKSAALIELLQYVGDPNGTKTVITRVELRRSGTVENFRDMLRRLGRTTGILADPHYHGFRFSFRDRDLDHHWQHNPSALQQIFCMHIGTQDRLTGSNPVEAIRVLDQSPTHPLHILYADDAVEHRIGSYFRRGFGRDLILFRAGGSQISLLVGQRITPNPGEDRVSGTYAKRLLEATVPLHLQGDGMRSFATVILHLLAPTTQSVLLLDEPEAFLHPPQARLLGEFIALERPPHSQLFVATHSPDVLQGLLAVAPDHLRVLRIERDGNVNRVKELDKAQAKAIGTDPLMKFSSVLSGIFHQRVIICESDADCMFYSAILDLPQVQGPTQPDVLFVQANGKHRMAALAEALRALGVRVDVVADIDVLQEDSVLERLILTLGGDWPAVRAQAIPLKKAIEQHKPWLNASEVAKGIQGLLAKAPSEGEFPKSLRAEIEAIFKKASPWDAVKGAGEAAIPAGQPTQHYQTLNKLTRSCGLWIVPVGELEGFCRSEGGHGPRWVQHVIEKHELASDPELARARDFVHEIWTSPRQN